MPSRPSQQSRVSGWLEWDEPKELPYGITIPGRPRLSVNIRIGTRQADVDFMLDTGADITILQPRDAHGLLKSALFAIDFEHDEASVNVSGVAAVPSLCVIRRASYTVHADDERDHVLQAPILIAQPVPFEESEAGNWSKISTLGRDVMSHFALHLDYQSDPPIWLDVHG